jgi:hypothetical protein
LFYAAEIADPSPSKEKADWKEVKLAEEWLTQQQPKTSNVLIIRYQ